MDLPVDDSDEAECFLRRNHLLKGIRSRVPMIKQMLLAGRNEKMKVFQTRRW